MRRLAAALLAAWVCLVHICLIPTPASGASPNSASKAELTEVVLRHLVPSECQTIPCLIAVEGKEPSETLINALEPLGRVSAATADDFVVEHGAVRGFLKRHAVVVDVRAVESSASQKATVQVAFLTTGLGSNTCRYRLRRISGGWAVEAKETTCTL